MYSIVQALVYLVQGRLRDDIEACQISLALDVEQGSNTSFAGLAYSVMVNSQTTFPLQKVMPKEGLELVTRDGDIYYVADGYHTLAQKSGSSPL